MIKRDTSSAEPNDPKRSNGPFITAAVTLTLLGASFTAFAMAPNPAETRYASNSQLLPPPPPAPPPPRAPGFVIETELDPSYKPDALWPTPAQFATFKSAVGRCTEPDGKPFSAQKKIEVAALLDKAEQDWDNLNDEEVWSFALLALHPMLPTMPNYGPNYDKLSPAQAEKLLADMKTGRIKQYFNCPTDVDAVMPILKWSSDTTRLPVQLRYIINNMLGDHARHRLDGPADTETSRRHFVKALILSSYLPEWDSIPLHLWSDGIDNSNLGNAKRAGLQAWSNRTRFAYDQFIIRLHIARDIAKENPDAARRLLMAHDQFQAYIVLELEQSGYIPARHTLADLKYWRAMAYRDAPADLEDMSYRKRLTDKSTPMFLQDPRIFGRIIETAAHLNGGAIVLKEKHPTSLEAFGAQTAPKQLSDRPVAMRALIAPDGEPVIVEVCDATRLNKTSARDAIQTFHALLPQPPAIYKGKPAYTWLVLPGPASKNDAEACTAFADVIE